MTAIPMTLREALKMQGTLVEIVERPERTFSTASGSFTVPAMIQSSLKWEPYKLPGFETPEKPLHWAMYLDKLPLFNESYRETFVGHFLDRFLDRRIAYDTPDQWQMALRRWANVNLPFFNQRYASAAVKMPLDDIDYTLDKTSSSISASNSTEDTDDTRKDIKAGNSTDSNTETRNGEQNDKSRTANSDYPDAALAFDTNYASDVTDQIGRSTDTETKNGSGRRDDNEQKDSTGTKNVKGTKSAEDKSVAKDRQTGRRRTVAALLGEQRSQFLNVDFEALESADAALFLQVLDLDEYEPNDYYWNRWSY